MKSHSIAVPVYNRRTETHKDVLGGSSDCSTNRYTKVAMSLQTHGRKEIKRMYHIITRLLVHHVAHHATRHVATHVAHHATRHVATHVAQAIQPMPQNTGPNMANVLRAMNQRGQILNSVNKQFQTNLSGEEADATYQNALEAD